MCTAIDNFVTVLPNGQKNDRNDPALQEFKSFSLRNKQRPLIAVELIS